MSLPNIPLNKTKAMIYMVSHSKVQFLSDSLNENYVMVSAKTEDNHMTALMIAVLNARQDMAEFLLRNGTDYRALDKHHENIFHKLCENPNLELAGYLMKEMQQRDVLADMLRRRNFASCKDRVELVQLTEGVKKRWFYVDVCREHKIDFIANVYGKAGEVLDLEKYGKVIEQGEGEPTKREDIVSKYNKIQVIFGEICVLV